MLDKQYFLRKSHINIIGYLIFAFIVLFVIGIIVAIRRVEIVRYVCAGLFMILAVFVLLIIHFKSQGLYIYEDKIYYKNIKKEYINITDIKAILIVKSYGTGGKYQGFYPLKDCKGDNLYTAIFVKNIEAEMFQFNKGDLWFIDKYKKQILMWVVYSKPAIDFLIDKIVVLLWRNYIVLKGNHLGMGQFLLKFYCIILLIFVLCNISEILTVYLPKLMH